MDGWRDEQIDGRTDGWMKWQVDRWMDGRTDRWTKGWLDGQADNWMDGQVMDRRTGGVHQQWPLGAAQFGAADLTRSPAPPLILLILLPSPATGSPGGVTEGWGSRC